MQNVVILFLFTVMIVLIKVTQSVQSNLTIVLVLTSMFYTHL